jgi:hypothetical protein
LTSRELALRNDMIRRVEPRSTNTQTNGRWRTCPKSDPPCLAVVNSVVFDRQVRTGEKNFGQRKRNAVLGAIGFVLRRIEFEIHKR